MTDFDAGYTTDPPPPPTPIEYGELDSTGWWISLIGGVALLLLGLWIVTNLYDSVVVLAWLVGISLIVAGVLEVLALHGEHGVGWAVWISGALLVAAGIAVLVWPDITLWALAVMAGIGIMVAGVIRVIVAFVDRDEPDFVINLAIGAFGIVLGALVLAWPEATLTVLALILGIRFIVSGVVAIGLGWQLHRLSR
ncbi:MAG TPA: DUF308 domain-containing protein [Acidimicrobiales bacterium]|nr:DUF308 domain-containing protein [Acidimicrobiales bacterium]